MSTKQAALFDDRFLESFAGQSIVGDPKVAIMELIANAWDAGASKVDINWPYDDGNRFSITDNGHGMTESQFDHRFRTLSYNRARFQGVYASIPDDNDGITKRPVFGRNGKGRFAGFSFGQEFFVRTWREGKENTFRIFKDRENSLSFQKKGPTVKREGHGTEIYVEKAVKPNLDADQIKTEISMRFMTDPHFSVSVNAVRITFSDIPEENVEKVKFDVEGVGPVTILIIDVQGTDRTTQQHGIAWQVHRRLVGECTWKGSGQEHLVDGRKAMAKRYTFIVQADCLKDKEAVLPDWTGFFPNNEAYLAVFDEVQRRVKEHLLQLSKSNRETRLNEIKEANTHYLRKMGLESRDRWEKFIESVQEECPSITDDDLQKLSSVLANLESSESKYGLVQQLSEFNPDNLDDLNAILDKWNIDLAKIVLDELEYRLRLLEQLRMKVKSDDTDEVQELQPLFHRGLWIFGPEYETIEYTSNEGMTTVIQKLFGSDLKGRTIRPDFAIIPDGTVGFYGYPKYDDEGGEIGVDKLTIVELKRPGVKIDKDEKDQPLKYIKELHEKGLIKQFTTITCFVLGSSINPFYAEGSTEWNGRIKIIPLDFETVIRRAKSRLHNLYSKVSAAPFLQDTRMQEFLKGPAQIEIWEDRPEVLKAS
ncbi:MAG: ATP-binding protein [Chitinophagaceae bacterium]|nr:MAG: ATP-binding protein [Chitinophagaceae bacterium]